MSKSCAFAHIFLVGNSPEHSITYSAFESSTISALSKLKDNPGVSCPIITFPVNEIPHFPQAITIGCSSCHPTCNLIRVILPHTWHFIKQLYTILFLLSSVFCIRYEVNLPTYKSFFNQSPNFMYPPSGNTNACSYPTSNTSAIFDISSEDTVPRCSFLLKFCGVCPIRLQSSARSKSKPVPTISCVLSLIPQTKYAYFFPSIAALLANADIYSPSSSAENQFSLNSNHSFSLS